MEIDPHRPMCHTMTGLRPGQIWDCLTDVALASPLNTATKSRHLTGMILTYFIGAALSDLENWG